MLQEKQEELEESRKQAQYSAPLVDLNDLLGGSRSGSSDSQPNGLESFTDLFYDHTVLGNNIMKHLQVDESGALFIG